jgi:uncharacterized metal-binding protein
MKIVLRPIPVVFACRGCGLDAAAQEAVAQLDRRGHGEAGVMGRDSAKARSRYPVYVVEGCSKRCATQWLGGYGVAPQRTFILDPSQELGPQLERVSAEMQ